MQWSTGLAGSEEKSGAADKCGMNSDTNRMDNDPHPPYRGGFGFIVQINVCQNSQGRLLEGWGCGSH